MRWRIPVVFLLAALVAVSCQDVPTATEDAPTDATSITFKSDNNNGAVRWIPDPFCGLWDATGDLVFPVDCKQEISTYSQNRNAVITVTGSVDNSTGMVVTWDAYNPPPLSLLLFGLDEPPVPCVLFDTEGDLALYTVKWSGHISPSGNAKFTCHFASQWEWEPPPGWVPPF